MLLTGTASDIVAGQIESLSLALGVIFVVMSLMFLSVKVGFLAILPNVLPILIFFGVMGWFGIFLNLGTSLIAAIALGIAVDSTIHYMARLNMELQRRVDQMSAVVRHAPHRRRADHLRDRGALPRLPHLRVLELRADPAIRRPDGRDDGDRAGHEPGAAAGGAGDDQDHHRLGSARRKLGEDPARTIPLFAGLRPAQARIVILMGEIKRFAPGEPIVRRGEMGDEMYVIIQGRSRRIRR